MLKTIENHLLENRWDDGQVTGMSESELLLYRSNILGSDKRVTNYGGGNTSAKVIEKDPLTGSNVEVLWVKGSGGDIGSIRMDGFATLYMDKLQALKDLYRGVEFEDEMVGYLPHCTFRLNPRAASIDTPLHAYVPRKHVDHVHADAIIAIAAAKNSKELTRQIFGDRIGWLPWKRPGYRIGAVAGKLLPGKPECRWRGPGKPRAFHLGRHGEGLLRPDDRRDQTATDWLADKVRAFRPLAGYGTKPCRPRTPRGCRPTDARDPWLCLGQPAYGRSLRRQRRRAGIRQRKGMEPLAALGTSCPDHFLRTKIRPLVVDSIQPKAIWTTFSTGLPKQVAAYREDYAAYYERCKHDDSRPCATRMPSSIWCPASA